MQKEKENLHQNNKLKEKIIELSLGYELTSRGVRSSQGTD